MDGEAGMRTRRFTAAFTGQLSKVQDISLPGTKLRVEQGHEYLLEIMDGGQGRLTDLTLTGQDQATSQPVPT
jgi:hypothetical protein